MVASLRIAGAPAFAPARTVLLDPARFEIAAILEEAADRIRAEMEALRADEFVPWPNQGVYNHGWLAFPLSFVGYGEGIPVDLARNRARCPRTVAAVGAFGRARTYGFSRLMPGAHIAPHRDGQDPGVLRAHLGLAASEGGLFRIGGESLAWRDGRVLVFDGLIEHEAANVGAAPRTILLVDFRLTPDEAAYFESVRARNAAAR